MNTKPLSALQVIGTRYRGSEFALGDDRSLDAYAASGIYEHGGVPVRIVEPRLPEGPLPPDPGERLGLLGGAIAVEAAAARQAGQAILLTGGDCTHCTGILGALQQVHGAAARIGLVWFDAHGDFNTPKTTLSGYLGGMPLAVCAGLAWPRWREGSQMLAPLPTDRIALVGLRNLDPAEEQLIRATSATVAAVAPGFPGEQLEAAIAELAGRCDLIYLHIDSDILDGSLVPNHQYPEPNGPDLEQVRAAVDTVMSTGKVAAQAVVSVYGMGEGCETSVASGIALIRAGLEGWRRYGLPDITTGHNSHEQGGGNRNGRL
jgi:arginase